MKNQCPCCGFYTLDAEEPKFDICPVCFWENDPFQTKNPEEVGANSVSLIEAKGNYRKFGACEVGLMSRTRAPKLEEMFSGQNGD